VVARDGLDINTTNEGIALDQVSRFDKWRNFTLFLVQNKRRNDQQFVTSLQKDTGDKPKCRYFN